MDGPLESDGAGFGASGGSCASCISSGDQCNVTSYFPVRPVLSTTVRPRNRARDGTSSEIGMLDAYSSLGLILIPPQRRSGGLPGSAGAGGFCGSYGVQLPSFDSMSCGPSLPSFRASTS